MRGLPISSSHPPLGPDRPLTGLAKRVGRVAIDRCFAQSVGQLASYIVNRVPVWYSFCVVRA